MNLLSKLIGVAFCMAGIAISILIVVDGPGKPGFSSPLLIGLNAAVLALLAIGTFLLRRREVRKKFTLDVVQ
jgi:hypothetical protein